VHVITVELLILLRWVGMENADYNSGCAEVKNNRAEII